MFYNIFKRFHYSKTVEAPEDDIDELAAATGDEGLHKAIEQEKSQRAQKNIFKVRNVINHIFYRV